MENKKDTYTSEVTCKKCGHSSKVEIPLGINEEAYKNSLKCSHCFKEQKKELKRKLFPYYILFGITMLCLVLLLIFPNFMLGGIAEKNECKSQGKIWNTDTQSCFDTKKEFCDWEERMFGHSMCSAGYWEYDE